MTDSGYIGEWNRISHICIRRIRQYAPKTLILVGSYNNNGAREVPALDPPDDERIVYNFHCYEPLEFTHQGAFWVDAFPQDRRIPFAESGTDTAYFERLFADAVAKAKKEHTALYCGEYGVIDLVPPKDALEWFRAINTVFERHQIPRCVWSYKKMNFGIADPHTDSVREELLKVL